MLSLQSIMLSLQSIMLSLQSIMLSSQSLILLINPTYSYSNMHPPFTHACIYFVYKLSILCSIDYQPQNCELSSELSVQSGSPSHCHRKGTHCPFAQRNSSTVLQTRGPRKQRFYWQIMHP